MKFEGCPSKSCRESTNTLPLLRILTIFVLYYIGREGGALIQVLVVLKLGWIIIEYEIICLLICYDILWTDQLWLFLILVKVLDIFQFVYLMEELQFYINTGHSSSTHHWKVLLSLLITKLTSLISEHNTLNGYKLIDIDDIRNRKDGDNSDTVNYWIRIQSDISKSFDSFNFIIYIKLLGVVKNSWEL